MLAEDIIEKVKPLARTHRLRKSKSYVAANAILDSKHYERVIEIVDSLASEIAKNGEKILCKISCGEIIDSGAKQFEILKGVALEIYDYKRMTAAFVRIYHLRNGSKDWTALYVDENPETPWWSEEERR